MSAATAIRPDVLALAMNDTVGPTVDELDESWLPVGLAVILAEGHESPTPSLLRTRDNMHAYFYRGCINGIHGDAGVGKSWIAYTAAAQILQAGRRALILDFEASAAEVAARLRAMGVSIDEILDGLTYIQPSAEVSDAAIDSVLALLTEETDLVVIDSLGEAFGIDGVDENNDPAVGPWLRRVARRIASAGPAVLIVDHGTKAGDNPLLASGSKRKGAAITGASYLVKAKKAPTREHEGVLWMICGKDRHGTYRRGEHVATVDVTPYGDGGVTVNLHRPVVTGTDDEIRAYLCAKAAINAAKDEGKPLSGRTLLALMKVKASTDVKRGGIELAVARGHLVVEDGPKRSQLHRFVSDWVDTDDL